MPLTTDFYTSARALELIEEACPGENAEENLISVLQTDQVKSWILDVRTKKRVPVPTEMWPSPSREDFYYELRTSLGTLRLQTDLLWSNHSGEIQINKAEMDALLLPSTDWRSGKNSKRGRPREYDWEAFDREMTRIANGPDGLPEKQAELVRKMSEWCSTTWGQEPADSMIRDRISRLYRHIESADNS